MLRIKRLRGVKRKKDRVHVSQGKSEEKRKQKYILSTKGPELDK